MIVNTANEIGIVLREGRRQRGMTQQALASQIGVSRKWVVNVESGAPTAHIGLVLYALRAVGYALDLRTDTGGSEIDAVFGTLQ